MTSEDQRLAIANLFALAQAAMRSQDAARHRSYLDSLADLAPDGPDVAPDPRDDQAIVPQIEDRHAQRRMGAQIRGVLLGAGAHTDSVLREVVGLVRALDGASQWSEKHWSTKLEPALTATRADLAQDIVWMRPIVTPLSGATADWLRRWGGLRSLELNAFVAAFTRDQTHPGATTATSRGPDAGALRHALAVAQAGLALAAPSDNDPLLIDQLRREAVRVESALVPLLANLVAQLRAHPATSPG
ncbi:MAG: hypothetical protein Q8Q09_00450 [Deltaproteobacteria bacterium]|nr:hypothetical protein [Deltaproteobacteria bacterium]